MLGWYISLDPKASDTAVITASASVLSPASMESISIRAQGRSAASALHDDIDDRDNFEAVTSAIPSHEPDASSHHVGNMEQSAPLPYSPPTAPPDVRENEMVLFERSLAVATSRAQKEDSPSERTVRSSPGPDEHLHDALAKSEPMGGLPSPGKPISQTPFTDDQRSRRKMDATNDPELKAQDESVPFDRPLPTAKEQAQSSHPDEDGSVLPSEPDMDRSKTPFLELGDHKMPLNSTEGLSLLSNDKVEAAAIVPAWTVPLPKRRPKWPVSVRARKINPKERSPIFQSGLFFRHLWPGERQTAAHRPPKERR